MTADPIFVGDKVLQFEDKEVTGKLVQFEGAPFYKVANYDQMRPFFMSIVSDSNHWLFISSTGGVSAGRKNSGFSLFPYYTDDKITESAENTGSKILIRAHKNDRTLLWEPFSELYKGIYKISRNLYKSAYGNKIVFEEINEDLSLTYRYQWNSSNRFGFVKKSCLINNSQSPVSISVLDGIQNILPYGVPEETQATTSNLVDAYKRNELLEDSGIGLYTLSAIIVDRAEPSEALKANIAWSVGFDNPTYLLSSMQLDAFRKGQELRQETDVKAERGAYFITSDVYLEGGEKKEWMLVANVNQSMVGITDISNLIQAEDIIEDLINKDIELGTTRLIELNAAADGIQLTADKLGNARHFSNSLFNIMRGGIFDDNYQIEKSDFLPYIEKANKLVYQEKKDTLMALPDVFSLRYLRDEIATSQETDVEKNFQRLCFEYLPLKFSRRHGDPSRPWNKFSINTQSEIDGSKILDYQGNWRDIFQNWEALAFSYPEFIENMIHRFLNASTFDGYNPYRVTKDGFDWETIEPHDPWSYIGYWGDHQIIYLLKFLEFIEDHYPERLASYFDRDIFVYANVPYKIKKYKSIVKNPKDTIILDSEQEREIILKREELGADGALLFDRNGSIYKVNLIEKILVTVLAKLSNFIPEAGIWMNTQRPEWNDANNALVGNGVSMVTLYYLRRFFGFFEQLIEQSGELKGSCSEELVNLFNAVHEVLEDHKDLLQNTFTDSQRKLVMDGLGEAGSQYRTAIYNNGFSGHRLHISKQQLSNFIEVTKQFLDHSIRANRRDDKLYHSYNLISLTQEKAIISYLPKMLEGQVAVLSSGLIYGFDALELLNALRASDLFRPDQYSYILYPDKELPRFKDKNNIPKHYVESSKLLVKLLADGNHQIIEKDANEVYHFNGNFNNANDLIKALRTLDSEYKYLKIEETQKLLDVFEEVFNHKAFTGRSGTFFGYEGLGSIYWHMVSKLLLSVQEVALEAINSNTDPAVVGKLLDHYYEINEGLGVHKSPKLHGAIPIDPYSHTPGGKGAQQPGMTGQVKEDIICRFGELGIFVKQGNIIFQPSLLRKNEFLKAPKTFDYFDLDKTHRSIQLHENSLAFSYCQVPVIYRISDNSGIKVVLADGQELQQNSLELNNKISTSILGRTGEIKCIEVSLKEEMCN